MRHFCTNCAYIYDEALGDIEDGYNPGVKLEDIQQYFLCPVCGEGANYFQEISEEIVFLDKKNNLTIEEEMHYPIIKKEKSKIIVSVGLEEPHPSEEGHFISSVLLLDEYGDLVEEKFLSTNNSSNIIFDDYDLDEYEIRIRCNLHGVFSIGKIKNDNINLK